MRLSADSDVVRGRPAFTVVELLIVIAILTILVAMLVPSLKRARETTHIVTCNMNLRQLNFYLMQYTNESKGVLPPAAIGIISPGDWHKFIAPYAGKKDNERFGRDYLACPAEVGSYNGQYKAWGHWGSVGGYGVNYAFKDKPFGRWETPAGPGNRSGSMRITDLSPNHFLAGDATLPYIENPDWLSFDTDMDSDGVLDTYVGGRAFGPWVFNLFEPRHLGTGNLMFFDGSTRSVSLNAWATNENDIWEPQ